MAEPGNFSIDVDTLAVSNIALPSYDKMISWPCTLIIFNDISLLQQLSATHTRLVLFSLVALLSDTIYTMLRWPAIALAPSSARPFTPWYVPPAVRAVHAVSYS